MNLHERVLSVLGCKYTNDVLIDAPLEITPDMIASLKISEVVHGTVSDDSSGEISLGKLACSMYRSVLIFDCVHQPIMFVSTPFLPLPRIPTAT